MIRITRFGLAFTLAFGLAGACALAAQAVDTIDADTRGRIDRIASQVLEQTGVPSASVAVVKGGKLVYTHASGKARLESAGGGDGRHALLHRIDFEAVHRRGNPAVAGRRQAELGRCRGQVCAWAYAGRQGYDPADSFAYFGLPGLLARGLRDDADAEAGGSAPNHRRRGWAEEAARLSSRERSGNIPTPTSSLPAALWKPLPARR